MTLTNFPFGVSSFGIPQVGGSSGRTAGGSVFGKTLFVEPANGSDGHNGLSPDHPLKSLTQAFVLVKDWDTIQCAPGNYSGNYDTPINADAAFVSLVGVQATDMGVAPWAAPSDTALPIINVKARGWKISGFEFEGMTGSSAIRMTKTIGLVNRCDFFQVDNCLFSGGKIGIEFYGGGTYWRILNNHFSLLTTAGGAAIYITDSSFQIPALGEISGNRFDNNINHIDANAKGFSDTVIRGNVFQQEGVAQTTTIVFDLIGGAAGGNQVIGNWFDMAKAEFNTGGTQRVFSNTTDYGAGNWFKDGPQDVEMRQ